MKQGREIEFVELQMSEGVQRGFAKVRLPGVEDLVTVKWWELPHDGTKLEVCDYPEWATKSKAEQQDIAVRILDALFRKVIWKAP